MQQRRFILPCATILLLGGIFWWLFVAIAPAQVIGPCEATMNGADVSSLSTPGDALKVPYDGMISINFDSPGTITGHEVRLEFFKNVSWQVADGIDNGKTWSDSVVVSKYSRHGVGIYRVSATTSGSETCTGAAYVKITGKNPLTTTAGAAAAAATAIGLAGMAGAAVSGIRRGPRLVQQAMASPSPSDQRLNPFLAPTQQQFEDRLGAELAHEAGGLCLISVPMAAFQSLAFMLSGAGGPGAPAAVFRGGLYFSVSSILGSILAGLGTLVLGQQFALFFPSLTILIVWMIVWLGLGIMIPSLARFVSARRANALLRQWAARQAAQTEQGMPQ